MLNRIKEYSNEIPNELKLMFEDAPKDDIDWALVMYLFRHSTVHYGCFFEEKI